MRLINRTGERYGRLLVLRRAGNLCRRPAWLCRCDCGEEVVVDAGRLAYGKTKSCGCFRREIAAIRDRERARHGMSKTRTYRSWASMKTRCTNPRHHKYPLYGGHGVRVSCLWLHSFENFYADLGERPAGKTLDRIDPDGNYQLGNCRWATPLEQRHNRRCA